MKCACGEEIKSEVGGNLCVSCFVEKCYHRAKVELNPHLEWEDDKDGDLEE